MKNQFLKLKQDIINKKKGIIPSQEYTFSIIKTSIHQKNQKETEKKTHLNQSQPTLTSIFRDSPEINPKNIDIDNNKIDNIEINKTKSRQLTQEEIEAVILDLDTNKIYKLLYLLRITYMHKKVAKQRFIRELTRKWRFAAFVKKMARKKLELMYKSMHVSYLQMANEVFGEEEDNPSVMKEFERFTNNIGMFSGEEPLNDELSKKYVKTVQKKYVFKNNVIDDEHSGSKKYTKNTEDIK